MKAKIPITSHLNKKQKEELEKYIRDSSHTICQKHARNFFRRYFKLFCVVLNQKYGFGAKRLSDILSELSVLIEEGEKDEVFWEHIDMLIIDKLGMDLLKEKAEG